MYVYVQKSRKPISTRGCVRTKLKAMNMKKSSDKQVKFGVRLSPGEVIQLEAIARKLGITKSEVLRLSLSSQASLNPPKPDADNEVISEALDAVSTRVKALDDRLHNLESLLGSAVDLLLSMSRNSQPPQHNTSPQPQTGSAQEKPQPALPAWSAYRKKYPKLSPVMSEMDWAEFLKKRYTDEYGTEPDLAT